MGLNTGRSGAVPLAGEEKAEGREIYTTPPNYTGAVIHVTFL